MGNRRQNHFPCLPHHEDTPVNSTFIVNFVDFFLLHLGYVGLKLIVWASALGVTMGQE